MKVFNIEDAFDNGVENALPGSTPTLSQTTDIESFTGLTNLKESTINDRSFLTMGDYTKRFKQPELIITFNENNDIISLGKELRRAMAEMNEQVFHLNIKTVGANFRTALVIGYSFLINTPGDTFGRKPRLIFTGDQWLILGERIEGMYIAYTFKTSTPAAVVLDFTRRVFKNHTNKVDVDKIVQYESLLETAMDDYKKRKENPQVSTELSTRQALPDAKESTPVAEEDHEPTENKQKTLITPEDFAKSFAGGNDSRKVDEKKTVSINEEGTTIVNKTKTMDIEPDNTNENQDDDVLVIDLATTLKNVSIDNLPSSIKSWANKAEMAMLKLKDKDIKMGDYAGPVVEQKYIIPFSADTKIVHTVNIKKLSGVTLFGMNGSYTISKRDNSKCGYIIYSRAGLIENEFIIVRLP